MHCFFAEGQWDIWQMVMSCLPLSELLFLAAACHCMNSLMWDYALCRFHRLSSRFENDSRSFCIQLCDSNVVISGSFALFFIFVIDDSSWFPHNVDVYVARENFQNLSQGLQQSGFTSVSMVIADRCYPGNEVAWVVCVSNLLAGRAINVMVTRSPSPISLLFQFHSSLVMNYISVDTFFSTYPTLSSRAVGFPNPLLDFRKQYTTYMLLSYEKYRLHGFRVWSPSAIWVNDLIWCVFVSCHANVLRSCIARRGYGHICGHSKECPNTCRSSLDHGCLLVVIEEVSISGCVCRLGVERQQISWLLCEERCDGRRCVVHCEPFICTDYCNWKESYSLCFLLVIGSARISWDSDGFKSFIGNEDKLAPNDACSSSRGFLLSLLPLTCHAV